MLRNGSDTSPAVTGSGGLRPRLHAGHEKILPCLVADVLPPAPEPWEDGWRTAGLPYAFDWWYLDVYRDDGSVINVIFSTNSLIRPARVMTPAASIKVCSPAGTQLNRKAFFERSRVSLDAADCGYRAGTNTIGRGPNGYEVCLDLEGVACALTLRPCSRPWRPGDSIIYYDGDRMRYWGWLASCPFGEVDGYLSIGDKVTPVKGIGYLEHGYGTIPLVNYLTAWSWCRFFNSDHYGIMVDFRHRERYRRDGLGFFFMQSRRDPRTTVEAFDHDIETRGDVTVFKFHRGPGVPEQVKIRKGACLVRHDPLDRLKGPKRYLAKLLYCADYQQHYCRLTADGTVFDNAILESYSFGRRF